LAPHEAFQVSDPRFEGSDAPRVPLGANLRAQVGYLPTQLGSGVGQLAPVVEHEPAKILRVLFQLDEALIRFDLRTGEPFLHIRPDLLQVPDDHVVALALVAHVIQRTTLPRARFLSVSPSAARGA